MRLKIFSILMTLLIVLGMSSLAFAEEQGPPGFGAFYGEVNYADGTPLESGTIQGYLNGETTEGAKCVIKDGKFEAIVVGGYSSSENQPLVFKVTYNGNEYTAIAATEVLWNSMDFEEVKLSIDATRDTGNPAGETEKVKITISSGNISLKAGETEQLSVTVSPSDATVMYSSSNNDVASVSSGGLVTAVGDGTAVITATASSDGLENAVDDVSVTVTETSGDVDGTVEGGGTTDVNVSGDGVIDGNTTGEGIGTGGETTVPVQNQGFVDVPSTHWAYNVINTLSQKKIVGGYPGGLFKPENNISRAEFIKILTGAIGLAGDNSGAPLFTDVPQGEWYYGCVQAAARAGFSKGYDTGEFRPDAQITRQEMAVILIKAMGKENAAAAGEKTSFTDDSSIASWARGFVVTAVSQGLVNGYEDNTFRPGNNATRAEACAMISKLLAE